VPRVATSTAGRRAGRPLKFGVPTEPVSLRLPRAVIDFLESIDSDVANAIVKLHQRLVRKRDAGQLDLAGLYQVPGGRALILVRPEFFGEIPGVSLIPLSDGRAFLALDRSKGVADLELAVMDRLEAPSLTDTTRAALMRLRGLLQSWRREGIEFETRSIILAKRASKRTKPLSALT
jgi:hypothetical protein